MLEDDLSVGIRLYLRCWRNPVMHWTDERWAMVDYSEGSDWERSEKSRIDVTGRRFRKIQLFGVLLLVTWPCSSRK